MKSARPLILAALLAAAVSAAALSAQSAPADSAQRQTDALARENARLKTERQKMVDEILETAGKVC